MRSWQHPVTDRGGEHSRAVPIPVPAAAPGCRDSSPVPLPSPLPAHAWHMGCPTKEYPRAPPTQRGTRIIFGVQQQFQKGFGTPYFNYEIKPEWPAKPRDNPGSKPGKANWSSPNTGNEHNQHCNYFRITWLSK